MTEHSMYRAQPYPTNKMARYPLDVQKALPSYYREGWKPKKRLDGEGRGIEPKVRYDGFPPATYKASNAVRYFNVCYADWDIYKMDIPEGAALGIIKTIQDEGVIPPVSLLGFTGRGMTGYWFLVDADNPYQPPRWDRGWEIQSIWRRVQNEIYQRTRERLAADRTSMMNLTASVRLPGTIHKETRKAAEYWFPLVSGHVSYYTLEDLAAFFHVEPMELAPAERRLLLPVNSTGPIPSTGRKNGFEAVHKAYLKQFRAVWDMRGQFHEGMRHHALLIYSSILRCNRIPQSEILDLVTELAGKGCAPSLPAKDAERAVKAAFRMQRDPHTGRGGMFSKQQIADRLEITRIEAGHLGTWPCARQFGVKPARHIEHPDKIKAAGTRETIRGILEALTKSGEKTTCRKVQAILAAEHGITITFQTASFHISKIRYNTKSLRRKKSLVQRRFFS
jgi:hypothetical protein